LNISFFKKKKKPYLPLILSKIESKEIDVSHNIFELDISTFFDLLLFMTTSKEKKINIQIYDLVL
jgi:hypothetical protein